VRHAALLEWRPFVSSGAPRGALAAWLLLAGMLACSNTKTDSPEQAPGRVHAWADWPMPNLPNVGLPNPQQYTVSSPGGDEIVLDEVTRLTWQRRPEERRFAWAEAVAYCDDLTLAGSHDWRLPSRIELVSLLNLAFTRPTIDPQAFPDTAAEWFWTASQQADDSTRAWYVYFYFGYPDTDAKSSTYPVRCVR
jgi:hypothetical protein